MKLKIKLILLAGFLCLAMPTIFVPSAVAFDPQARACAGLGPGVQDVNWSVSPDTAGSASSVTGGALLCGTDVGDGIPMADAEGFLYGSIKMPWRLNYRTFSPPSTDMFVLRQFYVQQFIKTRCANPQFYNTEGEHDPAKRDCPEGTGDYSLRSGQYIGTAGVGVATEDGFITLHDAVGRGYVNQAPPSQAPGGIERPNIDCTSDAIACYQASDGRTGYVNMTIERNSSMFPLFGARDYYERGTFTLLIHPVHLTIRGVEDIRVFYTQIGHEANPISLCQYAGSVGGTDCGTSTTAPDDWVQKNGSAGTATCRISDWSRRDSRGMRGGVGSIIDIKNNVPGADAWSGADPDPWYSSLSRDWPSDTVPVCAPLTIRDSGGSGGGSPRPNAGAPKPYAGAGGAAKSGSQPGSSQSAQKTGSTEKTESAHKASSHRRFASGR